MTIFRQRVATLFLLLSLTVLLAEPSQSDDQDPKPIKVTTVPYVMATLDKITVTMRDESVQDLQVDQDGLITLGDKTYKAKGLSTDAVKALIRRHLDGVESITIDEFRANRISVLGEVYHQIFTEMSDGPMRVMDAIASANGFTPLANTRRVTLTRENAGHVEIYELDMREVMRGHKSNQNIIVMPGDVITVPRNFL
jgi:protein involved in polysaccharide export with SLBB domain